MYGLNVALADDPSSIVYGSILDGIFEGHIIMSDGQSFTIEKIARYFPMDERPNNYHSIIYHDKEINHARFRNKRSLNEISLNETDDFEDCKYIHYKIQLSLFENFSFGWLWSHKGSLCGDA